MYPRVVIWAHYFFYFFINDISYRFAYSKCLLYADDIKLICPVKSWSDALGLQKDLDALVSWCDVNGLCLNVNKCKCMSFHRKASPVGFSYCIGDTALDRITEVRDLGVLFDQKITFVRHVDTVVAKSYAMLGFIRRICCDFQDPRVFKALYFAFVRSILEYSCVVWFPNYRCHVTKIESIQKMFFKFMFMKFGYYKYIEFAPYDYKCSLLRISPLEHRRKNTCVYFVHDLLTGYIDAPILLARLNLYAPSRALRERQLLLIDSHRTNYGSFEPMTNMSSIVNSISDMFDFHTSRTQFRGRVASYNWLV